MRKKFLGFALCAVLFALCTFAGAQETRKIARIGLLTLIPKPDSLELIFNAGSATWATTKDETSP